MAFLLLVVASKSLFADPPTDRGQLPFDGIPEAQFIFHGVIGSRVKANIENWLLVAPDKNPKLAEVYADRESNREPPLVPWVGEFSGKYLISAVQAMRMSDDPELRKTVHKLVDRILELQAEDGYLGCWPKQEQLFKHWDLWEHYHIMQGLIIWSEQTGDKRAFAAACKAADLVCRTFLDTDRRTLEAGSWEMNMGVLHVLAILYRKTGEPRYLQMAQRIVEDFEKAGDYYRQGLQSQEFYRTPKPRWESLHSLQGMAELYRITGDDTFRQSFLHHWASIRRFDVRNTGGFSSGEQATGNPFADQPIETCCVIAWQTVMLDALRLTADSTVADDLELATFNAVAGAQHPSGEWFTYNTPMNGKRIPSHVNIAFQARPGGMFLNCCSANGPRGLGILSEWGVMQSPNGLAINFYGPMHAEVKLPDGTPVAIDQSTDYPLEPNVRMKINPQAAKNFTLCLRIPAWSAKTEITINQEPVKDVKPGEYLKLTRSWQSGDEIALHFDFALRYESGDLEQAGKIAVYRGPILLSADERFNADEQSKIESSKLAHARQIPLDATINEAAGPHRPWLVVDLPTENGKMLRTIDFASAGATGKDYRSWLPAIHARPPRPAPLLPADTAKLKAGPIKFSWRAPAASDIVDRRHAVVISDSPTFDNSVLHFGEASGESIEVPATEIEKLQLNKTYYWKIIARNANGQSESIAPYKRLTIENQ